MVPQRTNCRASTPAPEWCGFAHCTFTTATRKLSVLRKLGGCAMCRKKLGGDALPVSLWEACSFQSSSTPAALRYEEKISIRLTGLCVSGDGNQVMRFRVLAACKWCLSCPLSTQLKAGCLLSSFNSDCCWSLKQWELHVRTADPI